MPVAAADTRSDAGEVVFCNRLYGFNWMALDVGSATHAIVVKARLTTSETQKASALAAIGKRTLIVEPVKAGIHEEVAAIG